MKNLLTPLFKNSAAAKKSRGKGLLRMLQLPAAKFDEEEALALIDGGADIRVKNAEGEDALRLAAKRGDITVIRALIKTGADMAQAGPALITAVQTGNTKIALLLIEGGADANAKDANGNAVLHFCVATSRFTEERPEVITALLRHGADSNIRGQAGNTPLHVAVAHGKTEQVKLLLSLGADPDARNDAGDKPDENTARSKASWVSGDDAALMCACLAQARVMKLQKREKLVIDAGNVQLRSDVLASVPLRPKRKRVMP